VVILAVNLVQVIVFKGRVTQGCGWEQDDGRIKAGDQGEAISNQWHGILVTCICGNAVMES